MNQGHARLARHRIARTALYGSLLLAWGSAFAEPTDLGQSVAQNGTKHGVAACVACHGMQGEGDMIGGFPRIAGLSSTYIEAQLTAYAGGHRKSFLMQTPAERLTADERAAVARYFSQLAPYLPTPAIIEQPASPQDVGAWLASRGRWEQGLPACAQCHGASGLGVGATFPALTGQAASYLALQLHRWKDSARAPGPMALMPLVASKLSDSEIAALAAYYGGPHAAIQNPPDERSMPDGEYGKVVKLGEQIMLHTQDYAGAYVGNTLNCASCHLDAGRKANASPLAAAYVSYPAYRSKTGEVDTYGQRLQGCFIYSMNGHAPPLDDPVLVALESYSAWLARGAPVGGKLPGGGFLKLAQPALAADYLRGSQVYAQSCALCHGADGQGQSSAGKMVFPALWGKQSFNWGAGMQSIASAAGFIKANMPLALGNTLSDQQAWDVAMFINSHERPQDPRYTGSVQDTRQKYHDSADSMYGKTVNGHVLGGN